MPTNTDLVKDLPADFDIFGQAVDDRIKALNPETTLGDISYRSSTANTNTRLAIGTSGQVLTVSGGVPAWSTVSSGGMTLISEVVASNQASFSITSIPGTYKQLLLQWSGIKFVSASEQALGLRFNNDNGTNYASMMSRTADTAISTNRSLQESTDVYFLYSTIASSNLSEMGAGWMLVDNYASTTKYKKYQSNYGFYNGGANQVYVQNGTYMSTNAITSIDSFRTASNNFSNDTNTSIRLYGIS